MKYFQLSIIILMASSLFSQSIEAEDVSIVNSGPNLKNISLNNDKLLSLKIESKGFEMSFDGNFYLMGELIFYNNSKLPIKLPKTFDLGLCIFDSLGRKVSRNYSIMDEQINLINLGKSMRILPKDSLEIKFVDWKLHRFNVKAGHKYTLQYILVSKKYKKLNKSLNGINVISNKVEIIYRN